jgi:hypothetical protein
MREKVKITIEADMFRLREVDVACDVEFFP